MSVLQKKISKLAYFDGGGLLVMGILSGICGVIWRDPVGGMLGMALITLGAIELRGRWFLQNKQPRGTAWLVGSQIGLLLIILSYCLRNIQHPPVLPLQQLPDDLLAMLENLPGFEGDLEGFLQPLMRVVYSLMMLISIFYQGSMAMYYLRNTPKALLQPPALPIH